MESFFEVNLATSFLLGSFVFLSTIAFWLNWHQNYFKSRNIPYVQSYPLLGAFASSITSRVLLYENILKICNLPDVKNKPFFGIFVFHKPGLMIVDPELIKRILVKDFASFGNRYMGSDVHDPLGNYALLTVKAPLWKTLRSKLSPFFSSGKLKQMYYLVDKISDNLNTAIHKKLGDGKGVDFDVRELTSLYTTDVIASCAYGVEANSLQNPNGEFRVAGKAIFARTLWRGFERTSFFMVPQLMKIFRFQAFSDTTTKFIKSTISFVMAEREKSGTKRNDLIDTLIEIKNQEDSLPMDVLMAQAAVFFSAGFETSSSTQTYGLHEIAKNENVQDRLRNEIKKMLKRTKGRVTYDELMNTTEMPYLHQVVCETLRKYPVLPAVDRECINPQGYSLEPFSDFVVPHGMPIFFPTYALHQDESNFPEPQMFDPERFSPENVDKIQPFTYLPFGTGPRNCVGKNDWYYYC